MPLRHTIVAALALVGLAGCKVIVLGDSNSCMGNYHQCAPQLWPAVAQTRLDAARGLWFIENRSMPGMSAGKFHDHDGKELLSPWHEPTAASFHLERLLREDDLARVCRFVPFAAMAPRLVIALGTNDIGVAPAWNVVDSILALQKRALEVAPCLQVYVATIPPRFDTTFHQEPQRGMANAALRSRIPPDRLIEFDIGFTREDFSESGIHGTMSGHAKRADAAMKVLFPGLASANP